MREWCEIVRLESGVSGAIVSDARLSGAREWGEVREWDE